mmetsp:Transcript_17175/g.65560  ORF Transcript_17175/g.65560 Transcript_17175/m.65560 type:complete len:269 (-) Transcript_17175:101-907(-)
MSRVSGAAVAPVVAFFSYWGMSHKPAEAPRPPPKPVKLGYWQIRGLVEPIRTLCAYGHIEVQPIVYQQGDRSVNFDKSMWYNVKNHIGLDFPNLPYLFDNGLKLTQSDAILRHLCRRIDEKLLGTTDEEQAKVDMLLGVSMDFRMTLVRVAYRNYHDDAVRAELQQQRIPSFLAKFERFAALHGGPHILGSRLTIADFVLYDLLDVSERMAPGVLSQYPSLKRLCLAFEDQEAIRTFIDEAPSIPLNNMHAKFGAEPQPRGLPASARN